LPIRLETGTQTGDTGIGAVSEGFEFIVMGAIQNFLFDETPQPLDQIQVWRVRRQIKEFYPKLYGPVGDRLALILDIRYRYNALLFCRGTHRTPLD